MTLRYPKVTKRKDSYKFQSPQTKKGKTGRQVDLKTIKNLKQRLIAQEIRDLVILLFNILIRGTSTALLFILVECS